MLHKPLCLSAVEGVTVEPTAEFAQLQLGFVDQTQWRYEVIRPLVLFADRTATQRAQETHTHPDTVRTLQRRFRQQGMLGLLPRSRGGAPRPSQPRVPEAVRQEIDRLKALYDGFHYRELARILFITFGYPIDHKTVKALWQASPVVVQRQLELWDYHAHADRYHARLQVIQLYYQGWDKVSISRFCRCLGRRSIAWIPRFEAEHFAGLVDQSPGPKSPRKVWLPLMVQVYHLQKPIPMPASFASGACWPGPMSRCARSDASWRSTDGSMTTSPMCPSAAANRRPSPIPYKATVPHQYWFIDGRRMDFALDGVQWWSLIILEGYSRTMLAGHDRPHRSDLGGADGPLYRLSALWRPRHLSPTAGGPIPPRTLKRSVRGCRSSMRRS